MNNPLGILGLPRNNRNIKRGAVLHQQHAITIKDETPRRRYALESNAVVLGLSSEFVSLYDL